MATNKSKPTGEKEASNPSPDVSEGQKKQRAARMLQSNVPTCSVEEALIVPQAIWDNFAGKPASPIQVCMALNISPASSKWRDLSGASIAYGFTSGGGQAQIISLEQLGKRAVAPTEEGDEIIAIQEAVRKPTIFKKFFEYYEGKKFPKDSIVENILQDWGVPKDRASGVVMLIKQNGQMARMLSDIKGATYVLSASDSIVSDSSELPEPSEPIRSEDTKEAFIKPVTLPQTRTEVIVNNNRVFISHGKNKEMVNSLKELLVFGSFDPIVSVERETTAISVPEKVFSDMRSCIAGIIHIEEERTLIDPTGVEQKILNANVLIEIGAAIALYGKKLILLCQKGITLPSNLQGLYRCEYDGDKLDGEATIKLLKTFNSFKNPAI